MKLTEDEVVHGIDEARAGLAAAKADLVLAGQEYTRYTNLEKVEAVPLRRMIDGEIYVINCAVYADSVSLKQLETGVGPKLLAMTRRVENCTLDPTRCDPTRGSQRA